MPNLELADVVQRLDLAVFRRESAGALRLIGRPPAWMAVLWPGVAVSGLMESVMEFSPYLDNFLFDAETHWKGGAPGRVRSGPWVETTSAGHNFNLEATALTVDGDAMLVVEDLAESFVEQSSMLQTARENMLNYERLNSEVQRKEILLHCVIHDMCSPLQNMMMALAMLDAEILAPDVRGMVQLGLQAGKRQESMIDNMLHTYSAELQSLYGPEDSRWPGLDLVTCTRRTIEIFRPLFAQQNVTIEFDHGPFAPGVQRVPGDEERFERVLGNLIANALRHSKGGSTVTVRLGQDDEWATIGVEDSGVGVAPQVQARLFEKFQQGAVGRGKVGLGLYFCRITVSKWGGDITYNPRPGGGSVFLFKLPKLDAPGPAANHSA